MFNLIIKIYRLKYGIRHQVIEKFNISLLHSFAIYYVWQ